VLGLDPLRDGLRLKARIGVQLQEAVFHAHVRLAEGLEFLGRFYLRQVPVRVLLERVGLAGQAGTAYGRLSGGQRRRFLLAVALLGQPELLVLDEPTAGLDVHARHGLWALIREARAEGRTVLLATHHLEEAEALSDRVAIIHKGRLRAIGTPAEVAALGPPTLESAFLALTGDAPDQPDQ
jgi:ABC-2 type transport system ATP-binding protein